MASPDARPRSRQRFARLRRRWRNASLKSAFVTYVAVYLVAGLLVAGITSVTFSWVAHEASLDGQEYNGLYLYDDASDQLVPVNEIAVGSAHVPMYVESGSHEQRIAPEDLPSSAHIIGGSGWVYMAADDEQAYEVVDPLGPDAFVPAEPAERPASAQSAVDSTPSRQTGGGSQAADGPRVGDEQAGRRHDAPMEVETSGEIDLTSLPTYDAQAREAALRLVAALADDETTRLMSSLSESPSDDGLLMSPVGYYLYEQASPEASAMITAFGLLAMAMFPLWLGVALALAARRFYGRRVRPVLALLDDASAKIAARDLDFAVRYDRCDEMGRLVDSFEVMRASLAQSQRELMRTAEERRRLNAAFAHDLRTPITVLKGKIELMAERLACACGDEVPSDAAKGSGPADRRAGGLDVAALERDVASLAAQVSRLERYVDAMGSLRKLDEREAVRTPVAPGALAHDLAEEGAGICRPHGIVFKLATVGGIAGSSALPASPHLGAPQPGAMASAAGGTMHPAPSPDPSNTQPGTTTTAVNSVEPQSCPSPDRNGSRPGTSLRISVDRALMLEVADNLIANAARYARTRVVARLSVEEGQPMGETAEDPATKREAAGERDAGRDGAAGEPNAGRGGATDGRDAGQSGVSAHQRAKRPGVQVAATRRSLVLVVDDDGPGFSPEALERGCEAFFGENRGSDHLGLGLNIAHILCERHDGGLELGRSSDTKGARVTARFAL